jgi:hypothetical protein
VSTRRGRCCAILSLILATLVARALAEDAVLKVAFTDDKQVARTLEARLLVEAKDGGILVEDRAGRLWSITPDRLQSREPLVAAFLPFDATDLGASLQQELGGQFEIVTTKHYVICTSADRKYAEWVGALFERLLRGFLAYWKRAGLELHEPAAPLPAIVFRTQQEYADFAARDVGPQLGGTAGYYSVRDNRIILYDLASAVGGGPAASADEVNRRVAAAPANVATIVHEATHQIAFNCGLHTRYADNPMWLTEGLAMYFETPDLRSGSGWQTAGRLNVTRLARFRDYARNRRKEDSLSTLISSENRFRDPEAMVDAYSESWALSYFLVRTHRDKFVGYLKTLAAKPRLQWDSPEQRRMEFEAAFGDIAALELEFARYIQRLGDRS